jgi:hypothetical protein
MKINAFIYTLLLGAALLAGCKKDNFEPPTSTLTGRVVYQDQPVGVRTNGVQLELWQPGYQVYTKIPVHVNQEGAFSASLFDGNYKLVLLRGNGPWVDNSDTIDVQVRGTAVVDVPVQPYYVIRNESFAKRGDAVTATCQVAQVATGRTVERVTLFVSSTQFVDATNHLTRSEVTGDALADLSQPLNFNLTLPGELVKKGYAYARIGVKTVGVAELLYTPVQKIQ